MQQASAKGFDRPADGLLNVLSRSLGTDHPASEAMKRMMKAVSRSLMLLQLGWLYLPTGKCR